MPPQSKPQADHAASPVDPQTRGLARAFLRLTAALAEEPEESPTTQPAKDCYTYSTSQEERHAPT
jgi:hypothetical protein